MDLFHIHHSELEIGINCLFYELLMSYLSPDNWYWFRYLSFCSQNSGGMYRTLAILSGAAAGLLFARISLMGDGGPPVFAAADNPTAKSPSLVTRTLTFLYLPVENFRLLVYPRRLSFDWSMDAITPVTSVYDPRNALSIALYVALFAAAKRSAVAASRARLHHHHRTHRCCSKTKYDRPVDLPDDPVSKYNFRFRLIRILYQTNVIYGIDYRVN